MAKSDGEMIVLEFDHEIVSSLSSSMCSNFRIDFDIPEYVIDGGLESVSRVPIDVQEYTHDSEIDLDLGTISDLEVVNGVLMLEEL